MTCAIRGNRSDAGRNVPDPKKKYVTGESTIKVPL